jgi:hypothetical protein
MVCFMPAHVLKSSETSSRTVMELLAVETYFLAGNGKEGRAVWKVLGEFISKRPLRYRKLVTPHGGLSRI